MGGNSDLDQALHRSVLKRREPIEEKMAERDLMVRQQREEASVLFGAGKLTREKISALLKSDRRMYYRTEELNDKLFLHFGGFTRLENLEKFTGLKTLYAESNALDSMSGLETMTHLRSLFLQQNCIRKIEGLQHHPNLWSLNLSENFLDRIEGVSILPGLNTLNLAGNRIGFNGISDVIDLTDCSVACLDLQNNKIDDIDFLPEVLMQMPNLKVLYLKGNPFVKKLPNYRKTLIAHLPNMTYLDDRPVFKDEYRAAVAFNRGGMEEERAERRRIKDEEREEHLRNMNHFREMVNRAKAEKKERVAMRAHDKFTDETDPVESNEARMGRLKKEWTSSNSKDLQDDARERAKKQLETAEGEYPRNKLAADGCRTTEKARPASPSDDKSTCKESQTESAGLQDTRTLRYDDIWDSSTFRETARTNYDDVYEQAFQRKSGGTEDTNPRQVAQEANITSGSVPVINVVPPADPQSPVPFAVPAAGAVSEPSLKTPSETSVSEPYAQTPLSEPYAETPLSEPHAETPLRSCMGSRSGSKSKKKVAWSERSEIIRFPEEASGSTANAEALERARKEPWASDKLLEHFDGSDVIDGGRTDGSDVIDGGTTDGRDVIDGGRTDGRDAIDGGYGEARPKNSWPLAIQEVDSAPAIAAKPSLGERRPGWNLAINELDEMD